VLFISIPPAPVFHKAVLPDIPEVLYVDGAYEA
jgi:hypothetical protein